MKRQYFIFTTFVIVILAGIGVFAQNSDALGRLFKITSTAQNNDSILPSEGKDNQIEQIIREKDFKPENPSSVSQKMDSRQPLPDEIAFEVFFIRVVTMERNAAKAGARGESGAIWRNYLKREGFTEHEIVVIRQTANEFATSIAPIQKRMAEIIKNGRAVLAQGNPLPPPPPELAELQRQRTTLAIDIRDQLQNRLGPETVEKAKKLIGKSSNSSQLNPTELPDFQKRIDEFNQRKGNLLNRKEGVRHD